LRGRVGVWGKFQGWVVGGEGVSGLGGRDVLGDTTMTSHLGGSQGLVIWMRRAWALFQNVSVWRGARVWPQGVRGARFAARGDRHQHATLHYEGGSAG
jgi:hypothetical protein